MVKTNDNISLNQNNAKMAVAFDLDDTLYPESAYARSGFNVVADYICRESKMSKSKIFGFLWAEYRCGARGNNFDRLIENFKLDINVGELVELYRTHNPNINLTQDAISCLDKIKDHPTGIITDGRADKQRGKLRALDLFNKVDFVCISDEFGSNSWKPATEMFEAFLKAVNRESNQAVYIADNPAKDFEGPNKIGMRSIWIYRSWGEYSDKRMTNRGQPTAIVNDLRLVPELIQKWGMK